VDRFPVVWRTGLGVVLLVVAVVLFFIVAVGETILGMTELEQVAAGLALLALAMVLG
jgi:hypothetical protein